MRNKGTLTTLIVCVYFGLASPAFADAVTHWNAVTVLFVAGGPGTPPNPPVGRGGPPGLLDIALVHAAIHDAVQAIEREFEPYFYKNRRAHGVGSPAAAVAAAARGVLVRLYPLQADAINARYNDYLAAENLVGDPGVNVGEAAALALYTHQYRAPVSVPQFTGSDGIGEWRPTPPTPITTPMAFLELAYTEPFTLKDPSQLRPGPPPRLTSRQYARDYDEVKAIGNIAAHPNATTDMARFWTGNYVVQWNETMRQIAEAHLTSIGDSARLFALANMSAADAAIAVWDSKLHFNVWRPQTAIREGDNDGNPRTAGDVTWTPFLANPNYPDYVSGANGLTGAFTKSLRLFFRTDKISFTVKNPNQQVVLKERPFTRFSDAAQEVVEARILLGIHFRFADEVARRLGEDVAQLTFRKILRPLRNGHHHGW
jgi:hypothetical protein